MTKRLELMIQFLYDDRLLDYGVSLQYIDIVKLILLDHVMEQYCDYITFLKSLFIELCQEFFMEGAYYERAFGSPPSPTHTVRYFNFNCL